MKEKRDGQIQNEDDGTFDRNFKYAVIAYAVIEFIAIAFVVYYKATH